MIKIYILNVLILIFFFIKKVSRTVKKLCKGFAKWGITLFFFFFGNRPGDKIVGVIKMFRYTINYD
jgi:hypothetical protein